MAQRRVALTWRLRLVTFWSPTLREFFKDCPSSQQEYGLIFRREFKKAGGLYSIWAAEFPALAKRREEDMLGRTAPNQETAEVGEFDLSFLPTPNNFAWRPLLEKIYQDSFLPARPKGMCFLLGLLHEEKTKRKHELGKQEE